MGTNAIEEHKQTLNIDNADYLKLLYKRYSKDKVKIKFT